MTKIELTEIVRSFLFRASIAESDRYIFEQYCDANKKQPEGIKMAPIFWQITSRALVHNLMMELAKLYESGKDVMGIEEILEICDKNTSFFVGGIDFTAKLRKTLSDKQELVSNLRKQRNKIWAHNDCRFFLTPEVVEHEFRLSWGEIEDLLNLAGDFGNAILAELGESPKSIHRDSIDDVKRIFETMQTEAMKVQVVPTNL